jgi:hypothetical protein
MERTPLPVNRTPHHPTKGICVCAWFCLPNVHVAIKDTNVAISCSSRGCASNASQVAYHSPTSNRITPDEWVRSLSAPPSVSSDGATWPTALLKHWVGTDPAMDQPPPDPHYVVQHLGGTKLVDRRCGGSTVSTIVEEDTLTFVPAGTEFKWHTRGPIEKRKTQRAVLTAL